MWITLAQKLQQIQTKEFTPLNKQPEKDPWGKQGPQGNVENNSSIRKNFGETK